MNKTRRRKRNWNQINNRNFMHKTVKTEKPGLHCTAAPGIWLVVAHAWAQHTSAWAQPCRNNNFFGFASGCFEVDPDRFKLILLMSLTVVKLYKPLETSKELIILKLILWIESNFLKNAQERKIIRNSFFSMEKGRRVVYCNLYL